MATQDGGYRERLAKFRQYFDSNLNCLNETVLDSLRIVNMWYNQETAAQILRFSVTLFVKNAHECVSVSERYI